MPTRPDVSFNSQPKYGTHSIERKQEAKKINLRHFDIFFLALHRLYPKKINIIFKIWFYFWLR